MSSSPRKRTIGRRLASYAIAGVIGLIAFARPAEAHQPVFVEPEAPSASVPVIADGTVSFATYGVIGAGGQTARIKATYAAGQEASAELLVPDQFPEGTSSSFDFLTLRVLGPSGPVADVVGGPALGRFDEPFSKTSYVRVLTWKAPAEAGTYTFEVTSSAPARFSLATGFRETAGQVTPAQPVDIGMVQAWYNTPPQTPVAVGVGASTLGTATLRPGAAPAATVPVDAAVAAPAAPTGAGDSSVRLVVTVVVLGMALVAGLLFGARRRSARRATSVVADRAHPGTGSKVTVDLRSPGADRADAPGDDRVPAGV